MFLFLSVYVLSILAFFLNVYLLPRKERTTPKLIELLLLYQLFFNVGVTSLFAFIGFTFYDQYVASYLNWPACPFQQEMANVNLAFGVLGLMCMWYRNTFWLATILGFSIWIFSDGLQHAYRLFIRHEVSAGNTGVPIYTDLLIPIVLVVLLALHYHYEPYRYKPQR